MTFATVEAAKTAQLVARTKVWDEINAHGWEHPTVDAANTEYDTTVTALRELLGPDAHCGEVDSDLYCTYSDLYKDRYNSRPRGHVTYEDVKAFVDDCKDSDLNHDD